MRDPLADDGEAIATAITGARVERIARADLDGHVGLSSRELYELGATIGPVGWTGAATAVFGRVQVVLGLVIACVGLAAALVPTVSPLLESLGGVFENTDPLDGDTESGFALGAIFAGVGIGGGELARRGVRRIRRGVEERRTAIDVAGVPIAEDPRGRATVALTREPDAAVASLLWLRGDATHPDLVEVRRLEETRLDADDRTGAEDALVRLADLALRADAAMGLRTGTGGGGHRGAGPGSLDARPSRAVPRIVDSDAPWPGALVPRMSRDLPAVDPREPVDGLWDPEPLTDEGQAELAARLVRARPLLWNPAELERLAVDPRAPLDHRPSMWPEETVRRSKPQPAVDPKTRRWTLWAAATSGVVWCTSATGAEGADDPTGARIVAYSALAIAVVLLGGLRRRRLRAPGRRLLAAVRSAGRSTSRGLEQGIPGPAGRVLVLHGVRAGTDRLELVHARALRGDDERLQVRTLAWRELRLEDDARTATQDLWRIADDAGFVGARRGEDSGALQRLNRALGRAVERRRSLGLHREPVAWASGAVVLFVAAAGIRHALGLASDGFLDDGLANRILSFTWPVVLAVVLWRAARSIRDPYGED